MRAKVSKLAAALTILLVVPVPTASALPSSPAVPAITWNACGNEFPGFECAVVPVPLDYDSPHGETTQIALARKPATDQARRIGSLFINPGGCPANPNPFLPAGKATDAPIPRLSSR